MGNVFILISLNLLVMLITLPLLCSKTARTVNSATHNRLGRISIPFTDKSLAVVDIIPTFIIGVIIGVVSGYSMIITIPLIFMVGIITHYIFNIKTPLNEIIIT
jgi:hypothetical protein